MIRKADVGFALRQIRRYPGVAGTAIVSLALGIGSATAVFSVVYGVVLDPFPYKDVGSLMSIQVSEQGRRGGRLYYTVDQFLDLRDGASLFEGVTASTISDLFWTGRAAPERLRGNHTTYDGLEIMGVPALIGRIFTRADRGNNVCVLGFRFWQRQFGGDHNVLGQTLLLNGKTRTIVGVMPPRFMWRGADVYVPLEFRRGVAEEGVQFVHVVGRVKPGVTPARAETELRPVIDQMRQKSPGSFPARYRVGLLSFADTFPSGISDVLWALFAAVGLLLLISCANVSNLLIAHSFHRAREMAVRISMGATRRILMRQLLTESAVVALLGGALGVALAWAGMKGILAMVPAQTIPDEADVRLNWPVLAFAAVISMSATILFGLLPALQSSRRDVVEPLKSGGRAGTTRRESWISGSLVVTEVGLSLMLLTAAALMVRSLIRVTSADYGVETAGVLTSRIPMDPRRYSEPERRTAFAMQLLDRLKSNPLVDSVGVNTSYHPFGNSTMPVITPGVSDNRPVMVHSITADYPRVFHIPLRRGRLPSETDIRTRRQIAVVSESFAQRYFPGRDPIGAMFRAPRLSEPPYGLSSNAFEVVGVVGDTKIPFGNQDFPEAYIPFTLVGPESFAIVMRAKTGDPKTLAPVLRSAIAELDRDQPVMDTEPVDYFIARYVSAGPKFSVVLFGAFGFLGLALVTVGIYGVIANAVARRTREIGLRMAVGATMADVMRMVIGRGVRLIALGVLLGVVGGLGAAGYLQTLLRGGTPYDPASLAAVIALLTVTGILACWLPARRAARIAPVDALRVE
ncbi:MAG TPA: ABC transporter permease [Bryobacteraceae bacterium]|nr:ABC transporter permease [Bryobacteraceae bacterium]